jgi:broad specificity phosphatase PhoE
VVAHGGSSRTALGDVMDLSVEEGVEHLDQDSGALNVVDVTDDGATVDVENDTDHLRASTPE